MKDREDLTPAGLALFYDEEYIEPKAGPKPNSNLKNAIGNKELMRLIQRNRNKANADLEAMERWAREQALTGSHETW